MHVHGTKMPKNKRMKSMSQFCPLSLPIHFLPQGRPPLEFFEKITLPYSSISIMSHIVKMRLFQGHFWLRNEDKGHHVPRDHQDSHFR